MREDFQKSAGQRGDFTATFERFGKKAGFKGYPVMTLLFKDVRDKSGKVSTEHIWFTMGKQFKELNLKPGDKIAFVARIVPYEKGYKGYHDTFAAPLVELDYKLAFPTNVRKLPPPGATPASVENKSVAKMSLL